MTMHQFNAGQVVAFIPGMFARRVAPGDYRVVAVMPDRDGDHMYRIKSPLEEHERVVEESVIIASDGYLPEVVMREPRGTYITLPKLSHE
jgi:hypothetical protein